MREGQVEPPQRMDGGAAPAVLAPHAAELHGVPRRVPDRVSDRVPDRVSGGAPGRRRMGVRRPSVVVVASRAAASQAHGVSALVPGWFPSNLRKRAGQGP
ncbi:hypothetical protein GCM10018784_28620 [Streptomyces hydrogenans]|nr:hypothetical protein GCM10018784_28620 [Streptomyces hydrogenans]